MAPLLLLAVLPSGEHRSPTLIGKQNRAAVTSFEILWPELATEATFSPRTFFTAINRQGVVFLWPIRLPGPDGASGRR